MKLLQVINKTNGEILAVFALNPFVFSEFSIEFGKKFERLFVIRNAKTNKIIDTLNIQNKDIRIKILTDFN